MISKDVFLEYISDRFFVLSSTIFGKYSWHSYLTLTLKITNYEYLRISIPLLDIAEQIECASKESPLNLKETLNYWNPVIPSS